MNQNENYNYSVVVNTHEEPPKFVSWRSNQWRPLREALAKARPNTWNVVRMNIAGIDDAEAKKFADRCRIAIYSFFTSARGEGAVPSTTRTETHAHKDGDTLELWVRYRV